MKTLLLVLIFAFTCSIAKAQDAFSLGPRLGYSTNTLSNNMDSINSCIKNTLQIGAFIRVGKKVYIQPEIYYQVVKSNLNQGTGISLINQDLTIKTIKVPALLGVKLISGGVANLRVMAGPAVTFLYDKKLNTSNMSDLWPIQSVDNLKNSTWSLQVGAGLDVLFMTLDVRYELGVDNIYNGNSEFEMKNNIFNVSLGIKLL